MDRNCDAFIRSNNTYDILIARESLEISDDRQNVYKISVKNLWQNILTGTRCRS
mgnify:CR=1 FL=1